jgi:CheY-like chemotaxis protein
MATRHTAPQTRNLFAGRQARILLAEDNLTNQRVAVGILKSFGLRADTVSDGAEALKALESIPYDLVLMDVQMPVMDGLEAVRQIRNPQSKVRNHAIPTIALTAHAMQGDRERCLQAGMNDYLSKPVSLQALAVILARWLPPDNHALGILPAAETAPPMLASSADGASLRTLALEVQKAGQPGDLGSAAARLDDLEPEFVRPKPVLIEKP